MTQASGILMNMKAIVASAAIAMSAAPAVHAATFDFAAIADTFWDLGAGPNGLNMEGTFAQVAGSVAGLALMDAGITVTDGTATSTRGTPHAFFDHDGGSGPAGLGVCSSGIRPTDGVSRCSSGDFGSEQNKSDDNITEGEVLGISFSQSIAFTDLIFTNEVHDPANGSILINGNELQITDGADWPRPTSGRLPADAISPSPTAGRHPRRSICRSRVWHRCRFPRGSSCCSALLPGSSVCIGVEKPPRKTRATSYRGLAVFCRRGLLHSIERRCGPRRNGGNRPPKHRTAPFPPSRPSAKPPQTPRSIRHGGL